MNYNKKKPRYRGLRSRQSHRESSLDPLLTFLRSALTTNSDGSLGSHLSPTRQLHIPDLGLGNDNKLIDKQDKCTIADLQVTRPCSELQAPSAESADL